MGPEKSVTTLWSSRPAFYLASVGAAVGLGSIWRLPYQVGSSGGSAFVLVFTLACLVIATPLLAAEFLIGRNSRLSPPAAAGALAEKSGRSKRWNVIGILGTVTAFGMMPTYTLVAGWVLAYTWKCASGLLDGLTRPQVAELWRNFLASPVEMAGWQAAFLVLVGGISLGGVRGGIEVASKVRAPALLILLLGLAAYGLATGDARRGLEFAFAPDLQAITPAVMLAAVGQAFYATGVGAAMMLACGSHVAAGTSLVRAALIITGSILLVSLLATLLIFPLVFHYGMNPAQGPELVFDVLATVFAEVAGGRVVGSLFFLLLVLAALTPSVAGMEPIVQWLEEQHGLSRRNAVLVCNGSTWLVGVGCVLSFGRWSTWHPLGWLPGLQGKTIFDILDLLTTNLLLPSGALATSVFVGWLASRQIVERELRETTPTARQWCLHALRYACPVAIIVVGVTSLW